MKCEECSIEKEFECDFCGKKICENCDTIVQTDNLEVNSCLEHDLEIIATDVKNKKKMGGVGR